MSAAPASPPASQESGFTLLEIMVGLLVSMMIMAGLSVAMRNMNRGWDAAVGTLEKQDLFANGFHVIAGDISRIERMPDKIESATRFLFLGVRSEVIYLLAERPASNEGGLYWVRLFLRPGDSGVELVRMRAPYDTRLQDFAGIAWRDPVVLVRGNYEIGFSYRAPRGGFPEWTGSWSIANRLPEQMRVEILDPGSGQPVVPPLVQTLDINAEADCVDPNSGGCTIRSKGELVARESNE